MIFIKEHFDKILEAYDNDYEGMNNAWGSQKNPNVFSEQISRIEPKVSTIKLPENLITSFNYKNISRQKLRDLEESNFRKIIAILAWGGMQENHFVPCISGISHGNLKKDKKNNRWRILEELHSKSHSNIHDIERVVNKITNDEYRQFVYHVRDSLALSLLGEEDAEKFFIDEPPAIIAFFNIFLVLANIFLISVSLSLIAFLVGFTLL